MTVIEQLKQEANLYTDVSGRWANADGVEKFTHLERYGFSRQMKTKRIINTKGMAMQIVFPDFSEIHWTHS